MKTIDEIYEQMLEDVWTRCGVRLDEGCDLAVRLYAAAAQVHALYLQSQWIEGQCFPQTAQGSALDSHAQIRNLTRTAAARAEGKLRFFLREAAQDARVIPLGCVCISDAGVRYETTKEVTIAAGATQVDAPARAVEAGVSGNTGRDTIHAMSLPPTGVVRCSNPEAFSGGADEESDDRLRARILDSYRRLPNGANAAYYENCALLFPGVMAAKAVGRARGIGTVDVYVATASGIPDQALITQIEADLASKREIAVDVKVCAPSYRNVNISLALQADSGADYEKVRAAAELAIRGYFTGARLSKPVLLSELHALLYGIEGLRNYHILEPASDIDGNDTQLPRLGTLTITELK